LLVLVGDCRDCIEVATKAAQVAESLGHTILAAVAKLWIGCAHYPLGHHSSAVEHLRTALGLLRREPGGARSAATFEALRVPVTTQSYLSMFLAETGDFAEAEEFGRDAIRLAETLEHPWSIVLACWQVGSSYLVRGEWVRACELLERAVTLAAEWGAVRTAAVAACELGYARALSGHAADGTGQAARALEKLDSIGFTWLRGLHLAHLGESLLLAGQLDRAEAILHEAVEFSRARGERTFEARALRLLGDVAIHHDPGAAGRSYQEALALASELGMRPLVAHCHLGLGKLYRRAGKHEQAEEHLTTATTMYREMDMRFWLEQAEAEQKA
jgi:tetratricopeptide (TPR) repeat protein